MGIIIDIVIVGFIALCIFLGYKRGLTGSILKIITFVLALIIAFILFKPVSNIIINNTSVDEKLESYIKETFIHYNTEESNKENQNMPVFIMEYINKAIENVATDAKNAIIENTSREISITIINAATAIVLYIIVRIGLIFIRSLTKIITKLPLIKQVDQLGGIVYGFLQSLIILYILFALISFISPLINNTHIVENINKSSIGSNMYNENILLKIIF